MKKGGRKKRKVVNPKFAKTGEYGEVIKQISQQGQCPFCPDNFRYHKKPILREENGWLITENSWPYRNSKCHLIIIAKRHMEDLAELTIEDFKTVKELADWAVGKFKVKGGALTIRFGDSDFTGATVSHLHFHLIVPKKGRTVNFPVG